MPLMRMVSNVVTNLVEVTRGPNVPSKGEICFKEMAFYHLEEL